MPQITTFLTYSGNKAEEAVQLYVSTFDGKITRTIPGPNGTVMGIDFELFGRSFTALNSEGFTFTPGISIFVSCDTQEEIDRFWGKLTAEGSEVQCGWVTDKFGVSWQIVPRVLGQLLSDADRAKAGRAMQAMLGMKKLDIAGLQRAFDGA